MSLFNLFLIICAIIILLIFFKIIFDFLFPGFFDNNSLIFANLFGGGFLDFFKKKNNYDKIDNDDDTCSYDTINSKDKFYELVEKNKKNDSFNFNNYQNPNDFFEKLYCDQFKFILYKYFHVDKISSKYRNKIIDFYMEKISFLNINDFKYHSKIYLDLLILKFYKIIKNLHESKINTYLFDKISEIKNINSFLENLKDILLRTPSKINRISGYFGQRFYQLYPQLFSKDSNIPPINKNFFENENIKERIKRLKSNDISKSKTINIHYKENKNNNIINIPGIKNELYYDKIKKEQLINSYKIFEYINDENIFNDLLKYLSSVEPKNINDKSFIIFVLLFKFLYE